MPAAGASVHDTPPSEWDLRPKNCRMTGNLRAVILDLLFQLQGQLLLGQVWHFFGAPVTQNGRVRGWLGAQDCAAGTHRWFERADHDPCCSLCGQGQVGRRGGR